MMGSLQAEDNRRRDGHDGIRWRPAWQWPDEAEDKIKNELESAPEPVLHVCAGASRLGDVRLDMYHPGADVRADAKALPFDDEAFGAVVIDPPFGISDPFERQAFITEAGRVLEPGGILLLYAPWFPGPCWAELEEAWVRVSNRHRLPKAPIMLTRLRRVRPPGREGDA